MASKLKIVALSLIGALLVSTPIMLSAAPDGDHLMVILILDANTSDVHEIAIVEEGTTYLCPPQHLCVEAIYDDVKDKSLEQIQIDARTIIHPTSIVPKNDG